jgi:glycerol-3-phosphate O-acyltransferase
VRASERALEEAIARGWSGLVFLAGGDGDDPFPRLVELQRRIGRPIYVVPALLVWSRRPQKLKLALGEILFGAPEAPNRLANALSFLASHRRAFLRLGREVDVAALLRERPDDSDAVAGRKLRGSLHLHLAREFRAAVGPPLKTGSGAR